MEYKVKLLKIFHDSERIKTFRFEKPKGFLFSSGQFVMLSTPKVKNNESKIPLKRAYSIASAHSKPYLEFCIAIGTKKGFSSYLHESAKKGDVFYLEGPFGEFTLKLPLRKETIFIAGGAGIAPIRSMLHSLSGKDFSQKIWLLFGIRNPEEFLYRKELESFCSRKNFNLIAVVSDYEGKDWKGECGFVCDVVAKHIKNGKNKELYMCGPPIMVETTLKKAKQINFSGESIHHERW